MAWEPPGRSPRGGGHAAASSALSCHVEVNVEVLLAPDARLKRSSGLVSCGKRGVSAGCLDATYATSTDGSASRVSSTDIMQKFVVVEAVPGSWMARDVEEARGTGRRVSGSGLGWFC